MARKKHRPRSFSKAFDRWLRWCEHYEDYDAGRRSTFPDLTYHEDFFYINDLNAGIPAMIRQWKLTAKYLRSSMKFRVRHPALDMHDHGEPGAKFTMQDIWSETPIALPFPLTYVEMDIGNDNAVMMLLEERIATDESIKHDGRFGPQYASLGIEQGDHFIAVHVTSYNAHGVRVSTTEPNPIQKPITDEGRWEAEKLSVMPVELHIPMGDLFVHGESQLRSLSAFPDGVNGHGFVEKFSNQLLEYLMIFLCMVHSPRNVRRKVPGLPPEAKNVVRKHRRKPAESTFYEHHVLDIAVGEEHEISVTEGTPGVRKRLHAVRGHLRRYKEPIKNGPNKGKTCIWVPAQWRGDKELGVVTKDYDFHLPEKDDGEEES